MGKRYMLIMRIDCGYGNARAAEEVGDPGDPNDPDYQCPWPDTPTSTSTTASSTSTEPTQSSWPTEYYDAPTAAGCTDSSCTDCTDGFKMVCVTDVQAKETKCHCEYQSGCARGAPELGMYSPTRMAVERKPGKRKKKKAMELLMPFSRGMWGALSDESSTQMRRRQW